ncbi:hypothetical protein P7K49_012236 [Saguinus oedipus]|uniref:Uncharacterized protein n=1 Tax=Saguinus oedipus TaxID=9490 RepID=A0ABQ9VSY3_SAGOE|nr:hypothetical protein P7K49_012236 [Saguinus oedipus]
MMPQRVRLQHEAAVQHPSSGSFLVATSKTRLPQAPPELSTAASVGASARKVEAPSLTAGGGAHGQGSLERASSHLEAPAGFGEGDSVLRDLTEVADGLVTTGSGHRRLWSLQALLSSVRLQTGQSPQAPVTTGSSHAGSGHPGSALIGQVPHGPVTVGSVPRGAGSPASHRAGSRDSSPCEFPNRNGS